MNLITKLTFLIFVVALTACSPDSGAAEQLKALQTEMDQLKTQLTEAEAAAVDGQFIHTVFFWMKEDLDDAARKEFEAGLQRLKTIKTVKRGYSGKAAGTPRDVVDNSYDYALILHFSNAADQDAYQIDPIHTSFVEASSGTWEKVQVYDSLIE
ncbi:MAG: Dabb family protein [Bacteroidota bacterium]